MWQGTVQRQQILVLLCAQPLTNQINSNPSPIHSPSSNQHTIVSRPLSFVYRDIHTRYCTTLRCRCHKTAKHEMTANCIVRRTQRDAHTHSRTHTLLHHIGIFTAGKTTHYHPTAFSCSAVCGRQKVSHFRIS